jgi:hypothetical protein
MDVSTSCQGSIKKSEQYIFPNAECFVASNSRALIFGPGPLWSGPMRRFVRSNQVGIQERPFFSRGGEWSGRRRVWGRTPSLGYSLTRLVSWEFRDSSQGGGLTEGLDGGDDGSGSGLCQRRHLGYPGSGPSTSEVKPLLPACFLLASQWLQRSSSCSSRGGRRRRIRSPRLRV